MEHWFDRLTRRKLMQTGAYATGALLVPASARASKSEPCYKDCFDTARKAWKDKEADCIRTHKLKQGRVYLGLLAGGGPAVLAAFLVANESLDCLATGDVAFVGAIAACKMPECGDREHYPGGNAPVAVCADPGYIPCGPTPAECCDSTYSECCQCRSGPVCCRLGVSCSCCGSGG